MAPANRKEPAAAPPPVLPQDPAHWTLGDEAQRETLLPLVLRELESPLPSRRARAAELLAEAGADEAIPALFELLRRESDLIVRCRALGALRTLAGTAEAMEIPSPGEVDAWRDELLAGLVEQLRSPVPAQRWSAAEGLGRLGDPRALPALVRALRDPHAFVRWTAVQALEEIGSAETVALLLPLLEDKDPLVRRSAVDGLGRFDTPESRQALRRALRDPDPAVRRNAIDAVARLRDTEAVDTLILALDPRNGLWVRYSAAEALGVVGDHRAIAPLMEAAEDAQVLIRRVAVRSLGQLRDSRAIPTLMRALKDPDPQVRLHAVEGLGRIGHEGVVPELKRRLSDRSTVFGRRVGDAARDAIQQIRSRSVPGAGPSSQGGPLP
ncbi:MAG: HEAT repeat domain-containing protein [Chloroflexia bacterium]